MSKILAFDRARRRLHDSDEGDAASRPRSPAKIMQLSRDPGNAATKACSIEVSVIVPTKGRPQFLNRCLASLVMQRFNPAHYEIIVVDEGRDGSTHRIVREWQHCTAGFPDITYLPSSGSHGPAAARNLGWCAARGSIVAFTDDDTIARTTWLHHGMEAFNDNVHAVWGRIVMPLKGTPSDYQLNAKRLEQAEFVTANCFCRKHVLEDIGGFDERFRFAWREDVDLHFRLLEYSATIVHAPEAVMMHPIRPAAWGVSLSQVKKIQFDALLFKKHPALYRQKIRAKPRWDFYLTAGSLIAAMAGVLSNSAELTLPSGLIWTSMTARFCTLRLKKTLKTPSHIAEMLVTSALIPPLAVFWRAVGAFKFRVGFL